MRVAWLAGKSKGRDSSALAAARFDPVVIARRGFSQVSKVRPGAPRALLLITKHTVAVLGRG